jgi:putative spermidine/putrescine transport system substrate-binding protein
MKRRTLMLGGASLAAMGVVGRAFAQAEPPKPRQIVVNASGGAMATALRKAYWDSFEKEYGIRIVDTSPTDFGKLRAMVESGNVEWTVTELGGQDAIRVARMGLVEKIDPKIVDRSGYPEQARSDTVFTSSLYSTVLAYRSDVFKDGTHPKSWAEFWDVKKFPGPRSLRNHPVDNLEFALLAEGVAADKLYPIDIDRAFKKLDEIKPHITVWWTTGAQPAQLLVDKEVVLASGWNGRFFDVIKKGAPIAIEWSGGSIKQGTFAIPKGVKDPYWAQKVLAWMTDPKRQAIYASELAYPGPHLETTKYVDAKAAPQMPNHPDNLKKQFWNDQKWWDENGDKAAERWNQWLIRK